MNRLERSVVVSDFVVFALYLPWFFRHGRQGDPFFFALHCLVLILQLGTLGVIVRDLCLRTFPTPRGTVLWALLIVFCPPLSWPSYFWLHGFWSRNGPSVARSRRLAPLLATVTTAFCILLPLLYFIPTGSETIAVERLQLGNRELEASVFVRENLVYARFREPLWRLVPRTSAYILIGTTANQESLELPVVHLGSPLHVVLSANEERLEFRYGDATAIYDLSLNAFTEPRY